MSISTGLSTPTGIFASNAAPHVTTPSTQDSTAPFVCECGVSTAPKETPWWLTAAATQGKQQQLLLALEEEEEEDNRSLLLLLGLLLLGLLLSGQLQWRRKAAARTTAAAWWRAAATVSSTAAALSTGYCAMAVACGCTLHVMVSQAEKSGFSPPEMFSTGAQCVVEVLSQRSISGFSIS